MTALEDASEFGKRVAAARGYVGMGKPEFSELLGYARNASTPDRWERGELGKKLNNRDGRRQVAEKIVARTGCPRSFFDLDESDIAEIKSRLARQESVLERVLDQLDPAQETEALEADEERVARQSETNGLHSEEPRHEPQNG